MFAKSVEIVISCHHVIQASVEIEGYMFGNNRKTAIIG